MSQARIIRSRCAGSERIGGRELQLAAGFWASGTAGLYQYNVDYSQRRAPANRVGTQFWL
jgi:hypothetical protein